MQTQDRMEISAVTESTDRNCMFIILGENLHQIRKVWLWTPDDVEIEDLEMENAPLPEAPPEDAVEGMLMGKPDCHFASACGIGKIPDGYKVLPTVLWLESETGFSTPWLMNRPILNTLSDYEVMPGQLLTLYGRNLCAGDEYIREKYLALFQNRDTGQRYPAEVLGTAEQVLGDEKPYCLHIKVPDPLPAGQYSLSVNLLNCGQFGYSDPVSLEVVEKRSFLSAMSRMDFHTYCQPKWDFNFVETIDLRGKLVADGVHSDWAVLQEAIDNASPNPTIVLLPSGKLGIERTLHVQENVVLQGTGNTEFVVPFGKILEDRFDPEAPHIFDSPRWFGGFVGDYRSHFRGNNAMVWLDNCAGLSGITICPGAGADTAIVVMTQSEDEMVRESFLRDCKILNMHGSAFPAGSGCGFDWGGIHFLCGTEGFTMVNCKIQALEPIFAHAARHPHHNMRIENCDFSVSPIQGSNCVFIRALYNSIIKDTHFSDSGRAFSNQMGMSNNVLIGNVITGIAGLHNASEILMSETGATLFQGQAVCQEGNCLRLDAELPVGNDGLLSVGTDFYAYILYGKGMGQYRKITGNSAAAVYLESPFRVEPDATSRIGIKLMSNRNLWLRNQIRCSRGALQFVYGAGFDNMVVGNEFYDAPRITAFGLSHTDGGDVSPAAFNFLYDNRLTNTAEIAMYGSLRRGEGATESGQGADGSYLYQGTSNLFGNIIRRNQIFTVAMPSGANQYYNVWLKRQGCPELCCPPQAPPETGAINLMDGCWNVVECNYIYNAPCGIAIRGGGGGLCRRNKMNRVAIPFVTDCEESIYLPEYEPTEESE